jgi:hypothetical protein
MATDFSFGSTKHPDTAKKTRRSRMRQERDELKQKAAQERQEYSASLTPQMRLSALDRRLGVGVGAVKERAKLLLKTEAKKPAVKQEQVITIMTDNVDKEIVDVLEEESNKRGKLKYDKASRSKNSARGKRA